jgi:hypothetical protein
LFDAGAGKVSAYVTHVIFPQESWRKFLPDKDPKPFSYFYSTDSVPEVSDVIEGQKPFIIMSLAKLVHDAVLKY